MIKATYTDSAVMLQISGADFQEDLRSVLRIPKHDRKLVNKSWTISNPEKYIFVPAIKTAVEDRQKQLDFLAHIGV